MTICYCWNLINYTVKMFGLWLTVIYPKPRKSHKIVRLLQDLSISWERQRNGGLMPGCDPILTSHQALSTQLNLSKKLFISK